MKRYLPLVPLLVAVVFLSSTGFQCGSAELTSAKLYIQQKQFQKAEESLLKEVAKNDKDEEAWFLLGQVRLEVRNYPGMNEAYNRALAISDAHKNDITRNRLATWGALYNEGVSFYNKGRDTSSYFERAVQDFKSAAMLEPDSSSTYFVLALAQRAQNDNDGAQQSLETALAKKPTYVEAARFLGQLRYASAVEKLEAKDTVAARAAFLKSVTAFELAYKSQPDNVDNITNLIDVYDRAGEDEKAESVTRDAVSRDKANPLFRYAYGVFLLKKEQFADAVEQFTAALQINPAYGDAKYNLGVSYLNWGVSLKGMSDKRYDSDKKSAAKATLNSKDDAVYKEKFKQALPYLEESAQVRTEDAALWTQLGRLYAILNMPDKSKTAFERADKLIKSK